MDKTDVLEAHLSDVELYFDQRINCPIGIVLQYKWMQLSPFIIMDEEQSACLAACKTFYSIETDAIVSLCANGGGCKNMNLKFWAVD